MNLSTSAAPPAPHSDGLPLFQKLLENVFNAARAPSRPAFDSFLRRVKNEKRAVYDHLMTLDTRLWTHHDCAQHTRIGDTVTSNDAESTISQIGAEVR